MPEAMQIVTNLRAGEKFLEFTPVWAHRGPNRPQVWQARGLPLQQRKLKVESAGQFLSVNFRITDQDARNHCAPDKRVGRITTEWRGAQIPDIPEPRISGVRMREALLRFGD